MSAPIPSPPPDASETRRGLVSTGTQSIAGDKTLTDDLTVEGELTVDGLASFGVNVTVTGDIGAGGVLSGGSVIATDEISAGGHVGCGTAALVNFPDANVAGAGALLYDTTGEQMMVSDGSAWSALGGGGGGLAEPLELTQAMSIEGTNYAASITLTRSETLGTPPDETVNPYFRIGDIQLGGVDAPMLMFMAGADNLTEKPAFVIEYTGTVASVSDGNRRSHYEAFLQEGDVVPVFRLSSSPDMTFELGPGGQVVPAGSLTRSSNVTTAVATTPHGLSVGDSFLMSHSEANFQAFTSTPKTVASAPTIYSITYADTGSDATSTIDHHISGMTDIHFKRAAANTAQLALGGTARVTFRPGSLLLEDNVDLYVRYNGGTNPLLWASYGYNRVAIGATVPGAKLHVTGTATGEVVNIIQSPASHANNMTEWWDPSNVPVASMSAAGLLTASAATLAAGVVTSNVADGASAVGHTLDTSNSLSTSGAKLLSLENAGSEKAYFDKDGGLTVSGVASGSNAITLSPGQRLRTGNHNDAYLYANSGQETTLTPGSLQARTFTSTGNYYSGTGLPCTFTSHNNNNSAKALIFAQTGNVTATNGICTFHSLGVEKAWISTAGRLSFDATDSSGTPGAATINKPSGQVSIASGAASVVVTNSLVSTTSIVVAVLQQVDATLTQILSCVPGSGSFTVTGNATATADTKIGFVVFN